MKSSEWPSLDSALGRLEGLPDAANAADEAITSSLRQKFAELLVNHHNRKAGGGGDEAAIMLWANQITNRQVFDSSALYSLFELQLKHELGQFWETLDVGEPSLTRGAKTAPPFIPNEDSQWNMKGGRRFHCSEGCEFTGDELYLAHRDRGHHPVPI